MQATSVVALVGPCGWTVMLNRIAIQAQVL